MNTSRLLLPLAVFSICICLPATGSLRAEEPSQSAINRAQAFLGKRVIGDFVTGYVHLGASYTTHEVQSVRYVTDENDKKIPGKFALVYRYKWDASGTGNTDIAFVCDPKGNVEDVRVLGTDAVLQEPFLVADATIQILGNVMIEAFREKMTDADVRRVQRLVDAANSEGLLEFSLMFRQAVER